MRTWLVFALLGLCCPVLCFGQYKPTTTWPYLYEEFQPGKVVTFQGAQLEYDKLNVYLGDGSVHYVDDGTIMRADVGSVLTLTVGEDVYFYCGGRMNKLLRRTASGAAVVLRITVDEDAMSKSNIGYGTSSVASTSGLATYALGADTTISGMAIPVSKSMDDVLSGRSEGENLILKEVLGLAIRGSFVPATRNDVFNIPGVDKKALKDFIKTEKIRFSKVDDLEKLVEYLNTL